MLATSGGRKVDLVVEVEFGANLPQTLDCIATGGTICTYSSSQDMTPTLPFYRMMFMDLTVRTILVYDMPEAAKAEAIIAITAVEADGGLLHRIAEVYPLDQSSEAHKAIAAGNRRGCVVVKVQEV